MTVRSSASRRLRRCRPTPSMSSGWRCRGVGNLHSHTFQRGFAGLTERRGEEDDHFWTWREAMYDFVGRLTPDDVEAIAAMAFIEMIESGFTAVAEFHYLHHGMDGSPMPIRRAEPADRRGCGGDRHRPHAAPGFLRAQRLRRPNAVAGPAPLHLRPRSLRPAARQCRHRGLGTADRRHRHRAPFAARRHPGRAFTT